MTLTPKIKALIATCIFSIMLIVSIILTKPTWNIAFPILIFYVLLILNTYFSVELFAKVIPDIFSQKIVDMILVIFYGIMAFSIGNAIVFSFILSIFFSIATMKYALVLNDTNHPKLLKRKIIVDSLGILLGLITLGFLLLGYEVYSLWGLVLIFAIANVCMFFVWPLYKPDSVSN